MKYVLHVLKKKLQSEKHCAQVHGKLAADKRFALSAQMAQERIPQLEKAIEILSKVDESLKPKTDPEVVKRMWESESKFGNRAFE